MADNPAHPFNGYANEDGSALPPKPTNWLVIYAAIGMVGVLCLIAMAVYFQAPKKSAPVKKRKIPATQNVFAMVISPLDSLAARAITREISAEIGKDSAVTQMIIGGTAVYKRCVSLADFSNLMQQGIVEARPETLEKQTLLLSSVAGVITADTLPTKLYIIGWVDPGSFDAVAKRVTATTSAMSAWNKAFKNIDIVTYIPPTTQETNSARTAFIQTFRANGHKVEERAIPR